MLRRSRSREPLHKGAVKFTMGSDDAAFSLKRKANKWAQPDAAGSGRPGEDIPACWRRAAWRSGFRRRLLGWFARNKRDLPWRRTKDPYAVWLSEIMLQQTQAPTVVRYFERFLTVFPTLEALAQAQQAEVLRLWEGLGYYRRAVQLHEAARKIVRDFGGHFPQTPEELLQLPGIGRYTAGAILSIAFDQRQPILEANTTRLWARLLAYSEPASTAAQRLFWQMAEWILPRRQVGRLNQALMELGSTVCLPRRPRCAECPVSRFCLAYQQGLQETIPRQRAKPAVELCHEAALIVRCKDRVLVRHIPPGERWAGLWDFPRFSLPSVLAEADDASPGQAWLFSLESPDGRAPPGGASGASSGDLGDGGNCRLPSAKKFRNMRRPRASSVPSGGRIRPAMADFLVQQMAKDVGMAIRPIRLVKTFRYAVTRYRVRVDCYEAEYLGSAAGWAKSEQENTLSGPSVGEEKASASERKSGSALPVFRLEGADGRKFSGGDSGLVDASKGKGEFQWVRLGALEAYPMSSPGRKLAHIAQNISDTLR